uniref:Uncharacterized protein n=1 Tax=Tetranychus urticae TaxID=32264 RepID=T1L663_TETUR
MDQAGFLTCTILYSYVDLILKVTWIGIVWFSVHLQSSGLEMDLNQPSVFNPKIVLGNWESILYARPSTYRFKSTSTQS